ncbi:MAG: CBS domain-containing protein [Nitrospirota bacterium]
MKETIGSVISRDVVTVRSDQPLKEVVDLMNNRNISCVVVVEDDRPVGILTERDIIRLAVAKYSIDSTMAASVMSKPLVTLSLDVGLYEAAIIMETNNIRRLVIVDRDGRLLGIVTQTDLIKNIGIDYYVKLETVDKVMVRKVIALGPADSVSEAMMIMSYSKIGLVVVAEDGIPRGIFTERDLIRIISQKGIKEDLMLKDVMSTPVYSARKGTKLFEAAQFVEDKRIKKLPIVDESGRLVGIVTQSDIIKNLQMDYVIFLKNIINEKDNALKEAETRFRIFVDNALEGVMIVQDDMVRFVNSMMIEMLGFNSESEIIKRNIFDLIYEDDRLSVKDYFSARLKGDTSKIPHEFRLVHRAGSIIFVKMLAVCIEYDGRDAFLCTVKDISGLKEAEKELSRLTIIDSLTGLYNQMHFYKQLGEEIKRSFRYNSPLSTMLLDIDDFRGYNDKYGPREGDKLLARSGWIIDKSLRDTDMKFRYINEEIAVVMPETGVNEARLVAERLRKMFAETVFEPLNNKGEIENIHMTLSIGLTAFNIGDNLRSFVKRVEDALQEARKAGGDRVVLL